MKIIISLMFFSLLISCKSTKDTQVTEQVQKPTDPESLVFSMKKSGCYGTCPTYLLKIYYNRYAEFIGIQHTEKLGTHAKTISKDSYKTLKKAFNDANFFDLKDKYESMIADLPSVTLTYKNKDQKKSIIGKRERPEILHKLQFQLEKIAGAKDWTFISASTGEKKKQKIIKSEIVVDIAKGNQLAKWFSTMKEKFGVQILRKLSDNSDSWLIGIDPRLHKPEDVLKYLQSDPVVKKAAFNVEFEDIN